MTQETTSVITELSTSGAVVYLLYGFGVVMFTLAVLWITTMLVSVILRRTGLDRVGQKTDPGTGPAREIPPETVAVITAAVHFAVGGRPNIRSISRKSSTR